MGDVVHDAVIVTYGDYIEGSEHDPRVAEWRDTLPEEWRQLVIGPVPSIVNGYVTWILAPDGSKSHWSTDREGGGFRQDFLNLFAFRYEDGSSPFEVGTVAYGHDFSWLWMERGVKVGDYVVYDKPPPPGVEHVFEAWQRRRDTPSLVVAVRDGTVWALARPTARVAVVRRHRQRASHARVIAYPDPTRG